MCSLNRLAADYLRDRESLEADRNRTCALCHGPLDLEESDKTGVAHKRCSFQVLLDLDMIDGPDWDSANREANEVPECPWPANVEAQEFAF